MGESNSGGGRGTYGSPWRKTVSEANVRNRGFLKRSEATSSIAKRLPSSYNVTHDRSPIPHSSINSG